MLLTRSSGVVILIEKKMAPQFEGMTIDAKDGHFVFETASASRARN
jgi:hypothetical protein